MSDHPERLNHLPLILITGAAGYVGGRLLQALHQRGQRVRCLARRPEFLTARVGSATEVEAGDVLDGHSLLYAANDLSRALAAQGSPEDFPVRAGQSVGLLHNLPIAAEVVELTIREERALLLERMRRWCSSVNDRTMVCTAEPRAANRLQPEAGLPQGKRDTQPGKPLAAYLHHLPSPTAQAGDPSHRTRNRHSHADDHGAERNPGANFRAALRLGRSDQRLLFGTLGILGHEIADLRGDTGRIVSDRLHARPQLPEGRSRLFGRHPGGSRQG